jgi:hypothetical protein
MSMSNESFEVGHKPGDDHDHDGGPQHGPLVTITINSKPYEIHRGHQKVSEIKTAGNVPLADDLEQVVEGKLVPLSDDGAVTIKGGEIFVSHPKDSGSL